jgi:hypothetical protein
LTLHDDDTYVVADAAPVFVGGLALDEFDDAIAVGAEARAEGGRASVITSSGTHFDPLPVGDERLSWDDVLVLPDGDLVLVGFSDGDARGTSCELVDSSLSSFTVITRVAPTPPPASRWVSTGCATDFFYSAAVVDAGNGELVVLASSTNRAELRHRDGVMVVREGNGRQSNVIRLGLDSGVPVASPLVLPSSALVAPAILSDGALAFIAAPEVGALFDGALCGRRCLIITSAHLE